VTGIEAGPRLAVVLVVLAAAGTAVAWRAGLGHGPAVLRAAGRATVQLAAVGAVIGAAFASTGVAVAFVAVMLAVASWTAGRRVTRDRTTLLAGVPIAAGALPALGVVLLAGLARTATVLVPLAGILIGGAMTATGLAGRRTVEELRLRAGEVEAALALGFLPRDAGLLIGRAAAATALVPALDQTRTVGLVTLPGAFVGVLLGGGSPYAAGAVQLLVLVALLAVEAVAIVVTVELVVRGWGRRPGSGATGRGRPAGRWRRPAST
jgi:putative ABC transport system permease protein